MDFSVNDETSKLISVIIGIANDMGETPNIDDLYDPKSIQNLKLGNYPLESNMVIELENFSNILIKHGVNVFRPNNIKNCNQIFARDVGFVINNFFFKSNILPKRDKEYFGIKSIVETFNGQVVNIPEKIHVEGGDVISTDNNIFIGFYDKLDYSELYTARTNKHAISYFENFFPNKNIRGFHLKKSNLDPLVNVLHLDCCLQLIGKNKAIVYPGAFTYEDDYKWIQTFFGIENIFEITNKEMYKMNSNILSISPEIVVSDPKFIRLNNWLESNDILVEKISFDEVSKQEGLFRCSSLPLIRN